MARMPFTVLLLTFLMIVMLDSDDTVSSYLSLIWSLLLWVSIFQLSCNSQQCFCRGQSILVFSNFLISTLPNKHFCVVNFLSGNSTTTFKSCLGNVRGGKFADTMICVQVVLCGCGYISDFWGCRYLWLQYCVEYLTQTSNLILACVNRLFMIFYQFFYSISCMNFEYWVM
jgi:hypothetical protein